MSVHFQRTDEWLLTNVAAENNRHLNNRPLFLHRVAGLHCLWTLQHAGMQQGKDEKLLLDGK